MWSEHIQHCLTSTISECRNCKASSFLPPNKKFSLLSFNCVFNVIVCLAHLYLDFTTIFCLVSVLTRFSTGAAVLSTDIETIIYSIEFLPLIYVWYSSANQANDAFYNSILKDFHENDGIHYE